MLTNNYLSSLNTVHIQTMISELLCEITVVLWKQVTK